MSDPRKNDPTGAPREPSTLDDAHGGEVLGHEYDGIREYDNPMPRWWVNVFWATFVFSIGYFIHYELAEKGASVEVAYAEDMRAARELAAKQALGERVTEDGLAKLVANASIVSDAKVLFAERCAPCHAERGEGRIGPNLTDHAWLHGSGKLMDIYGVVSEGVPAKGMPAWNRQLTPIELTKVVAYVGSLRGSNVPGKAAEGTLAHVQ
jgi:cytochrome c oxidase cbb3-type subunit 3